MAVVYDVVERAVEKLWLVSLLWMLIRLDAKHEKRNSSELKQEKMEKAEGVDLDHH